ncbi:MAG TPA: alpha-L-fucosidase [Candidatus Brocadiia bacterium]|nr:alpha-L-fucosidase [Candidatus Brocadiia bacterium]
MAPVPSYLSNYADIYRQDPRKAALKWFAEARYGLFLHYGLYSLLERHEWVQFREKIPVSEYEKLKERFIAEKFDTETIADIAVECGMRYVNITTRHHDGFCLFRTEITDFNSVDARSCRRDLVGELADACRRRGLGLCLYYSHGRDWRHPHAPNNDKWSGNARPQYDPPDPDYAYGSQHDLRSYLDFMKAQITELLTRYGPVAAIWLDGIAVPKSGDFKIFKCQDLYDHIHRLQPQVLVAYKQGLLGTEDFLAPEDAPPATIDKPCEVCACMSPGSWGYSASLKGKHLTADQLWEKLRGLKARGCNLLINTGPLPDGSLDPEDVLVLREVGKRIKTGGLA